MPYSRGRTDKQVQFLPYSFDTNESIEWYDHESEMKAFSKRFPDVVFTLHGQGEESGDIWVKYFKNGKMQKVEAQIVFAKFDEGQLK